MKKLSRILNIAFIKKLLLCLILSFVVILLTQETFFNFVPFKRLEQASIDARFQARGPVSFDPQVVIVEIGEESYRSAPHKWPWPRSYYAKIVKNLQRAGAKVVGIDINFNNEDFYSISEDASFRDAIRETKIVTLAGKVKLADERFMIIEAKNNYSNIFFSVDSSLGIVFLRNDLDGIYRRFLPIVYDRDRQVRLPTFPIGILNKYFWRGNLQTVEIKNNYFLLDQYKIPIYDGFSALINYYGSSGTFKPIKFIDVIDDANFQTLEEKEFGIETNTFDDPETGYLYDGTFKDKIVLIGSTNPEDKDLFPVPVSSGKQEGDNLMYGVEIHAHIIQNILDNNFLSPLPKWFEMTIIFLIIIATFFFIANLRLIKIKHHYLIETLAIVVIIAELFLIVVISLLLFSQKNYATAVTGPMLAVIFGYVSGLAYSYMYERKQKVVIKSMFSQYVNPTIVNQLIDDPKRLQLGGERKTLTVFFSDIERFTTISEQLPPEELVSLLNEYFVSMTEIILRQNGTLDKYHGDSIMAFFGAPIEDKLHAINACNAAIEMQLYIDELKQTRQHNKKPVFQMRIGINTGDMIVGNIGGVGRFDYTVIGDSVNIGSRLEAANKQYKSKILISENTLNAAEGRIIARELDMITVPGKNQSLKIFELTGINGGKVLQNCDDLIEMYSKGLTLYRRREWLGSIKQFEEVLKYYPEDYPTKLYIERAKSFMKNPPPDDWDGIFALRIK